MVYAFFTIHYCRQCSIGTRHQSEYNRFYGRMVYDAMDIDAHKKAVIQYVKVRRYQFQVQRKCRNICIIQKKAVNLQRKLENTINIVS